MLESSTVSSLLGRTRDQTRANPTTGGWPPIRAPPKCAGLSGTTGVGGFQILAQFSCKVAEYGIVAKEVVPKKSVHAI